MSRDMPTECIHGRCIDWGDFGPPDERGQGCEKCGLEPIKQCGRCEGQGVLHGYTNDPAVHPHGNTGWYEIGPCPDCGEVLEEQPR